MARVTDAKIIAALAEARGLVSVAARKLGVSRQQIYRRVKSSPKVAEAIEDARDFTTDTAEAALYKAIAKGEAWAVCFYLKTQGKERGYVETTDHNLRTPDGPIQVSITRRIVRAGGDS